MFTYFEAQFHQQVSISELIKTNIFNSMQSDNGRYKELIKIYDQRRFLYNLNLTLFFVVARILSSFRDKQSRRILRHFNYLKQSQVSSQENSIKATSANKRIRISYISFNYINLVFLYNKRSTITK